MVELIVVLAITGILLAMGLSSFSSMMHTNRTRAVADSIQAGLQMARSEAIRRNAPMRFQLVDSLQSTCDYSATSQLWVISQTNQVSMGLVAAQCGTNAYLPTDACDLNPATCANTAWIAFKSVEGIKDDVLVSGKVSAAVTTAASVVTFGPVGQVLPNVAGANSLGYIQISHASDGEAKTWGIRISPTSGAIKFCDPSKASPDPMSCS